MEMYEETDAILKFCIRDENKDNDIDIDRKFKPLTADQIVKGVGLNLSKPEVKQIIQDLKDFHSNIIDARVGDISVLIADQRTERFIKDGGFTNIGK